MKYDTHVLRSISFDLSNVRTNVHVMVKFSFLSYNCMDGSACHLCIHPSPRSCSQVTFMLEGNDNLFVGLEFHNFSNYIWRFVDI